MSSIRSNWLTLVLPALFCATVATSGCKWIDKLKKAKEQAAAAASDDESSEDPKPGSKKKQPALDADEALAAKLNGPIECINNASSYVMRSRDRYGAWITDLKAGPTGKERVVYGLFAVPQTFVDGCKKELAVFRKTKEPPTPELDKLAATFESKLDVVAPLIEVANKYYDQKDYKDDKFAKAKSMHSNLMKGFDEFNDADKALRTELKKLKAGMSERELAKAEKDGKKLRWHNLKLNILAEKLVQVGDADPAKLDVAAFGAVLTEYENHTNALEAYVKANAAEASKMSMFSSYQSSATSLVKSAKSLLRRARDKQRWGQGEIMLINAGSPQMVEGHPAHLVKAYNDLIGHSNRLRW